MKVLSGGTEGEPIHSIDRHYHGLKCQLSPLDSEDDTFRYVENIGGRSDSLKPPFLIQDD